MSRYQPYAQGASNHARAVGVQYRIALPDDVGGIARIGAERDGVEVGGYESKIAEEFAQIARNDDHAIWVAVFEGQVAGFARARKVSSEEATRNYPSPAGWYLLGLVVDSRRGRMGIGSGLSDARFEWLERRGVLEVYSFVSAENLASIDFHWALGFEIAAEGPGFLGVSFDCGREFLLMRRKRRDDEIKPGS